MKKDVTAFMDALPEEKVSIEEVIRVPQKGQVFHSAEHAEADVLNVDVLYTDEKGYGKTYQGQAIVQFDLKENENPYMTYKTLQKNIGDEHGMYSMKKGIYNIVIHLKKGTLTHLEKMQEN